MPSSPRTPTRRRKSSATSINLSFTPSSSQSIGYHSKRGSISRRSSLYSIQNPSTPRQTSLHDYDDRDGFTDGFGSPLGADTSNGFGNLADELAEAFDEDEEVDTNEAMPEIQCDGADGEQNEHFLTRSQEIPSCPLPTSNERSLSPPKQKLRSRHHHRQKSQYDGSDYGDDSDLERADGVSATLEARMAAIESLARRGMELNGSDTDEVVHRMVKYLRDLGSQSSIENGASRLITTHKALTSHLSNQIRAFSTLTHPLVSPFSAPPDPQFVEDILPLLTSLITDLPTPSSQPLSSLHSLHASTEDMTSTLTHLSDTLHMSRQTTSLASRRLRSTTEMVLEMRREAEVTEEAVRCLEKGNWETRLAGRECAAVCKDVIGGFEDVCNVWRQRLISGLEVGAA